MMIMLFGGFAFCCSCFPTLLVAVNMFFVRLESIIRSFVRVYDKNTLKTRGMFQAISLRLHRRLDHHRGCMSVRPSIVSFRFIVTRVVDHYVRTQMPHIRIQLQAHLQLLFGYNEHDFLNNFKPITIPTTLIYMYR